MPDHDDHTPDNVVDWIIKRTHQSTAGVKHLTDARETSPWIPVTLLNSFAAPTSPKLKIQYRWHKTNGLEFRGTLKVDSATSGAVAFNIIQPFRLSYDYSFLINVEQGSSTIIANAFFTASTGNVAIVFPAVGRKASFQEIIFDSAAAVTAGDGKGWLVIPDDVNGMNLVGVALAVAVISSSGLPTVQIRNATQAYDILSTKVSVDVNEYTSYTAATQPVIDTSKDQATTGDIWYFDVDIAGTGTKGLIINLKLELP